MTTIADLVMKVTSTSVTAGKQALDSLVPSAQAAEQASTKLTQATDYLSRAYRDLAIAGAAWKTVAYIKELAMLNARYTELGVVMAVVGKNGGYTAEQMEQSAKGMQHLGISMLESRNIVVQLVQSQVALADANKLARIAQDAAVIGNINSSDALQRMVHGIKTAQIDVLRTIGINVNFEQSYKELATQLHITTNALSEKQKMQARENAVMEEGIKISGAYEAAMGTAGKQMRSMTRYTEDLKVIRGEVFNEVLTIGVMAFVEQMKEANKQTQELASNGNIQRWGEDLADILAILADGVLSLKASFGLLGHTIGASLAKLAIRADASIGPEESRRMLAFIDQEAEAYADGQFALTSALRDALAARRKAHSDDAAARLRTDVEYTAKAIAVMRAYAGQSIAIQQQAQRALAEGMYPQGFPVAAEEKKAAQAAHSGKSPLQTEYESLTHAIKQKNAELQVELDLGRRQTDAEKLYARLVEDLTGKMQGLSASKKAKLETDIAALKVDEETLKAQKDAQKVAEARQEVRLREEASIKAYYEAQDAANAQSFAAIERSIQQAKDEALATDIVRLTNVSLAHAVEAVTIARLREKQTKLIDGSEEYSRLQREIDKHYELLGLIDTKDLREKESAGWTNVWTSIDNTAHDVFVNIFEGGQSAFKKLGQTLKASVLDLLYQMVARPFIISVGASVLGSGFSAAASAATGGAGSAAGSFASSAAGSFASSALGSTLFGGSTLASIGSSIGTGFMATVSGQSIGAAAAAYSAAGQTGVATGLQAGAAVPYVAAALAVAAGLGLFRSTKTVGSGLMGTVGESSDITGYDLRRKSGYLFGGPDYSIRETALDTATSKSITDAVALISSGSRAYADALGLGTQALTGFTTTLGSDLIHPDTGGIGIDFTGLNAEQITAKIQTELVKVGDAYAQRLIGTFTEVTTSFERQVQEWVSLGGDEGFGWVSRTEAGTSTTSTYTPSEFAREGETAGQTLARLATSLATVNGLWDAMGTAILSGSLASGDAASRLADAAGGIEALQNSAAGYYAAMYSDDEKRVNTIRSYTAAMSAVGQEIPATIAAYRTQVAWLESIVDTEPGAAAALATMYAVAPAFASVNQAVAEVGEVIDRTTADISSSLQKLQADSQSLARELLVATGGDVRAFDIAGYTAAEIALYDYNAAIRAQVSTLKDTTAATARVATERSTLQEQLDALTMTSTELLQRQRDALDESNRGMFDLIQVAQQSAAALAEVERVSAKASTENLSLGRQLLELQGDTAAIREIELAALEPSNRELQNRIWALQDEQVAIQETTRVAEAAVAEQQRLADQAAAATARVATERSTLQEQLDALTMTSTELLQRQRDALDESNRGMFDLIQVAQQSAAALAEVERVSAKASTENLSLGRQLLELQGDTAAIREIELAALEPSNRELQNRIWALQDEQVAIQETTRVAEAAVAEQQRLADQAAAAAKAVAGEYSGLWKQWLALTSDTATMRALELEALAPANRALQERIWALQDQNAVTAAATAAADKLKAAWSSLTDGILSEVKRIRGLSAVGADQGYASLQAQFASATAQTRAGDQEAAKALPGLAQALLAAAAANVTSREDLVWIQAMTANSLEETARLTALVDTAVKVVSSSPIQGAASGGSTSVTGVSSATLQDVITALREELAEVKEELATIRTNNFASSGAIAIQTKKAADILDRWIATGVPTRAF